MNREAAKQYRRFLEKYQLTKEALSEQFEGKVSFRSLFDEDYSWDQMFSRRAEVSPEVEIRVRTAEVRDSAEEAGKALARQAIRQIDEMAGFLEEKGKEGTAFLYHLLRDYYVPGLTDARSSLVSSCERIKRRNEEQRSDLRITQEEAASASLLRGERESKAMRFLEAADDYLFHVAREQQMNHLIRVISTVLQHCDRIAPGNPDVVPEEPDANLPFSLPQEQQDAEPELSYPRRCTLTTEDGEHFSVEVSDGIDRYFSSDLTLRQAMNAAEKLLTQS